MATSAPVFGQTAYYSLEGDFATGVELHDFFFNLSRSVSSAEDLRFQTLANSGGINAALDLVDAGGIDSLLELFDGGGASRGINDDAEAGAGFDSLLSWPGVAPNPGFFNTPLNPDPILAGGYRLQMSEFGGDAAGPWAVDLVGPANALTFTGAAPTGASTIDSLKFGTSGVGSDPATFTQAGGSLTVLGPLVTGQTGSATLTLNDGARVANVSGYIASLIGSTGVATVTGTDANGNPSAWINTSSLDVGFSGNATLNVSAGGQVSNTVGTIASEVGSTGVATVAGTDANGNASTWTNSGVLFIGFDGDGTLNVQAGGRVSNTDGFIGAFFGSTGVATVTGTDASGGASTWANSGNLTVGNFGSGTLNVEAGGLVTVGGTTSVTAGSTVNLNGGRFEFGTTTAADFGRINGVSGSLAGAVGAVVSGANAIASLDDATLQVLGVGFDPSLYPNIALEVDTSEVVGGGNTGLLFGAGASPYDLINNPTGEVEVITGERMRFTGSGVNNGQYDIFGGQLRFGANVTNNKDIAIDDGQLIVGGNLINEAAGTIQGRGFFDVTGTFTNRGALEFSGGLTDIEGTFTNASGGSILTTGGGTTTFYDPVVHNGNTIETSEGAFTVFLGDYSGAGSFTGDGLVQFEGPVNLGNSPAQVDFGGDVRLTDSSVLTIEIAGQLAGEFDQVIVGDGMHIDGLLQVLLMDGFELDLNQQYLIADIAGEQTGAFDGLAEGGLVGSFGGADLFITYAAGDGNDVALFTAIPEPTPLALLSVAGLLLARRQRWHGRCGRLHRLARQPQRLRRDATERFCRRRDQYDAWVANYGATVPSSPSPTPEPSAIVMLTVIFALPMAVRPSRTG